MATMEFHAGLEMLKRFSEESRLDPRANQREPIEPTYPLPYVSRRAIRRVTAPMPAPEFCRYCRSTVSIRSNAAVYGGREYGAWPYVYLCDSSDCGAYVGIHPHTDIPLGTLADRELRESRKINKGAFLRLSKARGWSRKQSYRWLASELDIPMDDCHWGWFSIDQAEEAGQVCRHELGEIA